MVKLFWVWNDEEQNNMVESNDTIAFEWASENVSDDEEVGQIALDILENHEQVFILAPVAGIELSDVDISVHDTTLTIAWERIKPKEFYEHKMEVKNTECFWWRFKRSIILPDNMDFSEVKAVMKNNLLVISIPKIRFESQSIKINKIYS